MSAISRDPCAGRQRPPDTEHLLRGPASMIACAVLALSVGGCATTHTKPSLSAEQQALNLESFDYMWTTIRDRYWDPELGGLDWDAVRDELRPRVAEATTMSDTRAPMYDLVNRLGVSHFDLIPAEAYEAIHTPAQEGHLGGSTGIDARVIGGCALVTSVAPESPASDAGVKPGWEIIQIDETDVPARLARIDQELMNHPHRRAYLNAALIGRLMGRIGDDAEVSFRDGDGQVVKRRIPLTEPRGERVVWGNFPPFHIWFEDHLVDGNIGYIAFNGFFDPLTVMRGFNDAMARFMNADGLIIDIRGNGGGMGTIAIGMIGWLVNDQNLHLGTEVFRDGELKLVVLPRPTTFRGPVAVLVDALSGSAAEFFASGLQGIGRACIVGTPTAGATLACEVVRLPNGDGFVYAIANFISPTGEEPEGVGVQPDIRVQHTRAALLEGRDLPLAAAIHWIHEQKMLNSPAQTAAR